MPSASGMTAMKMAAEMMAKRPSAKLAGNPGSEIYRDGDGKCGQEANREERIPKGVDDQPRDGCDEWRLIDVSPRQMMGARDVVEVVAKVSVLASDGQQQHKWDRGDEQYRRESAVVCGGEEIR